MDMYDCTLGVMRVGPYHYQPLRGVDLWLQQVNSGCSYRFEINYRFTNSKKKKKKRINFKNYIFGKIQIQIFLLMNFLFF